jgi:hypothetical protein
MSNGSRSAELTSDAARVSMKRGMNAVSERDAIEDNVARATLLAQDYAGRVRNHFGDRVRRIRLYGSAARGDWTPDSDVDVLVTLDDVWPADADWLSAQAFRMGVMDTGLLLQPFFIAERAYSRLLTRERAFALAVEREGKAL